MSEWKEYRFSDFVDINPIVKIPKGSPVSFVEMKDLDSMTKYCTYSQMKELGGGSRFKDEDTLFARITPCLENGKICKVRGLKNGYGFGSTEFYVFRGKDGVSDSDFVYYLSRSEDVRAHAEHNLEGSSGRQRVAKEAFDNLVLILPPLDEQKRIAGVLSSLDYKIDLLHRENATLEALAETLFRHYFIENPAPTWKEGKLGDYVIETIGGEWGTETPEGESGMPVRCLRGADVADLNDGIATRTPLRYVKPSKYEKIKPNNGDIILEISGGTDTCSTGRVAYINEGVKQLFDYPIVFSNFCRLLRVKEKYTYFVYCYFRHLHKQGEFFNLENGSSGIHNLNYKAALYDDLGWPVPTDKKLVIVFGEKVKPYYDKINANKKQILSLSAQRDTLLPYLMSGEVKICGQ